MWPYDVPEYADQYDPTNDADNIRFTLDGYEFWHQSRFFKPVKLYQDPKEHFPPAQQFVLKETLLLGDGIRTLHGGPIYCNSGSRSWWKQGILSDEEQYAAQSWSPHVVLGTALDLDAHPRINGYTLRDLALEAAEKLGLPEPRYGIEKYKNEQGEIRLVHFDYAFLVLPALQKLRVPIPERVQYAWQEGVTW